MSLQRDVRFQPFQGMLELCGAIDSLSPLRAQILDIRKDSEDIVGQVSQSTLVLRDL